jgi:hypothetical protein
MWPVSLLFVVTKTTPDPDLHITFRAPTGRAEVLLPELGRLAGVNLEAGERTRGDVLLIDVRDRPLPEVMNRIATATHSKWTQTETGYRLHRSDEVARQLLETGRKIESAAIRQAQIKLLADTPPFDAARTARLLQARARAFQPGKWEQANTPPIPSPAQRAAARMLAHVPPEQIGALSPGFRIVFSDRPGRAQRPFTPALSRIGDEARAAMLAFQAEAKRIDLRVPVRGGTPYSFHDLFWNLEGRKIERMQFQVSHEGFRRTGTVILIGAEDRVLARGDAVLPFTDREISLPPVRPKQSPLPLSKWDEAERVFYRNRTPLPSNLIDELCRPETIEPYEAYVGHYLRERASRDRKNIVALIPDAPKVMFSYMSSSDSARQLDFWQERHIKVVEETAVWRVLQAQNPLDVDDTRLNRDVLGRFLKQVRADRRISLDAKADFYAATRDAVSTEPLQAGLWAIAEDSRVRLRPEDRPMLALWGSLSASQRAAMAAGVRWDRLSPELARTISRIVFQTNVNYVGRIRSRTGQGVVSSILLSDATEVFRQGIAPTTLVTLKLETEEGFLAASGPPTQARRTVQFLPDEQAAMGLAQAVKPGLYPEGSVTTLDPLRLVPGKRRSLVLSVETPNGYDWLATSQDSVGDTSKTVRLEDLPEERSARLIAQRDRELVSPSIQRATQDAPPP